MGGYDGKIRIYINRGEDVDPMFRGYCHLQVNGIDFLCDTVSVPFIVDWNNDGKKDVICGQYDGRICLLLNQGTDDDPLFVEILMIQDGAGDLSVGKWSSPACVDWNRDGRKDLIVGDGYGKIVYFENKGTDEAPLFDGSAYVSYPSGDPLDVYISARPCVVDWDNDGVMDILCGSSRQGPGGIKHGHIHYFHSLGPLSVNCNEISANAGGTRWFTLRAGKENAARNYLVLATLSGTQPGIKLPGELIVLPINWDGFTSQAFSRINSRNFIHFMGILDKSGEAIAELHIPPLPVEAVGLHMHFAYTLNNPFDFASNPVELGVVD
ncbi:MAG: FG-GAP repeat domain-containing protein [Planctomycetota bacterium]|jgi:hypothetical protein